MRSVSICCLAVACGLAADTAGGLTNSPTDQPAAFGLPSFIPSLSGSWKTEAGELHKQLGLINADVTAVRGDVSLMRLRVESLETQIGSIQIALKASTNNVAGSQVLTGDVGVLTVGGLLLCVLVGTIGYYKWRVATLRTSSVILAASKTDQEARAKAAAAPPAVAAAVGAAIQAKNGT